MTPRAARAGCRGQAALDDEPGELLELVSLDDALDDPDESVVPPLSDDEPEESDDSDEPEESDDSDEPGELDELRVSFL